MESSPLFREVRLLVQNADDVRMAVEVLEGKATVSQAADLKGQDNASFYGDGDVIVLSYTTDLETASLEEANRILGNLGDEMIRRALAPALKQSKVPLELVLRFCNLSTKAVVLLADAVRANQSLIGFWVEDNPGSTDPIGEKDLKRACMETLAPLKWFQGKELPTRIVTAREKRNKSPTEEEVEQKTEEEYRTRLNSLSSWPSPVLRKARLVPETEDDEFREWRTILRGKPSPKANEREIWQSQVRQRIRSVTEDESEVENILANIELYELEKKIEQLLLVEE